MFGIKITEENLPLIKDRVSAIRYELWNIQMFVDSRIDWYVVTGYINSRGALQNDPVLLPGYIMPKRFEYNEDQIEFDWTMMVRKEEPE